MFRMYVSSLTHSSVAYIFASAELRAVIDWRFDCQCNGPNMKIICPDINLDLKRGNRWSDGVLERSCGPQLASVVAVNGSRGNLMYD